MSDTEKPIKSEEPVDEDVDRVDEEETVAEGADEAGAPAEEAATETAPAVDDDEDDSDLSDLDEDEIKNAAIEDDDDDYNKLSAHRRKVQSSGKKTLKKRAPKDSRGDDDEEEIDHSHIDLDPSMARRREIEARIDAAMKPASQRRKKLGEDDIEMMQDERISNLREKMRNAAIADAESNREGQPATHKLQLLPEVKDVLQKHHLADSILDNNLLEAVRIWLEPLPDASLPSYSIQEELFDALVRLPIKSIHLRESGLGKVVTFYRKSKQPQLRIKRIADKLVADWTRPIMGRSDNYREKVVSTRSFDPSTQEIALAVAAKRAQTLKDGTLAEKQAERRRRAHIPSAQPVNYRVAPKSEIVPQQRGGSTNDLTFKRLKGKLGVTKTGKKKSGVSIEGRGLNT
ncbi:Transcription factor IWS1 [Yarrowia sp. C11]|nr:Transcription factor IWS1 [Yarrowia sp. E02]KAG5369926.1 Transcription factor IWS1 [Yarrowia sp. C11]